MGSSNRPGASLEPKKLPQSLVGKEGRVLVVDDYAAMWPEHKDNIIVPERYCYFPESAERYGQKGTSLLETGRDENPETGMLRITMQARPLRLLLFRWGVAGNSHSLESLDAY